MGKINKEIKYVNPLTGELFERKSKVDIQFDEEEGYLFWNQKANIKTFLDNPLPREFSWAERGRVQELKHYILRDCQLLAFRSGGKIKPLGFREICRVLELSERQGRTFIRTMKEFGVLKEVKTDGLVWYAFNPIYGFKAKRVTLIMFLWFQEEFKKVLPAWVIEKFLQQAKELKPEVVIIK